MGAVPHSQCKGDNSICIYCGGSKVGRQLSRVVKHDSKRGVVRPLVGHLVSVTVDGSTGQGYGDAFLDGLVRACNHGWRIVVVYGDNSIIGDWEGAVTYSQCKGDNSICIYCGGSKVGRQLSRVGKHNFKRRVVRPLVGHLVCVTVDGSTGQGYGAACLNCLVGACNHGWQVVVVYGDNSVIGDCVGAVPHSQCKGDINTCIYCRGGKAGRQLSRVGKHDFKRRVVRPLVGHLVSVTVDGSTGQGYGAACLNSLVGACNHGWRVVVVYGNNSIIGDFVGAVIGCQCKGDDSICIYCRGSKAGRQLSQVGKHDSK